MSIAIGIDGAGGTLLDSAEDRRTGGWHCGRMVNDTPPAARGWRLLGWLGVLGHLAIGFWYAASGLVAPAWAVVVLLVIWVAMSVVVWRWMGSRPGWVVIVPIIEAAIWFAGVSAGDAFLDWTA